ncbi:MAG: VanZ family protein [Phycisphaerales bacterium]
MTSLLLRRTLWKWLFWAYFTVLTLLLLWPRLTLPAVVERPDLWVHCGTFGLFALLLCMWNPRRLQAWWQVVLLTAAAGVAYGGVTELLQSIPVLHRTAALDDWAADSLGVACGTAVFALVRWRMSRECGPSRT